MTDYRLAEQEAKFAELIWDSEPVNSTELVKLAARVMSWKKSTTYTVLRRLCERGLFKNDDATVTALVSRDEFQAGRSRRYVEDAFGGSLPRFLAAFIGGGRLSDSQADELTRLINERKGEADDGT